MRTLLVGLMSTLILSGCVSADDYRKLEVRVSKMEAKYYALDQNIQEIYDYQDKKYTSDRKKWAEVEQNQRHLDAKLNDHDKQIKQWQTNITQ
jgi:outer membrane murein-binding lipoprotein Lpp